MLLAVLTGMPRSSRDSATSPMSPLLKYSSTMDSTCVDQSNTARAMSATAPGTPRMAPWASAWHMGCMGLQHGSDVFYEMQPNRTSAMTDLCLVRLHLILELLVLTAQDVLLFLFAVIIGVVLVQCTGLLVTCVPGNKNPSVISGVPIHSI
jgi:hypothetical protein